MSLKERKHQMFPPISTSVIKFNTEPLNANALPQVLWLLGADSGALKREDLPADCFVIYQVGSCASSVEIKTLFRATMGTKELPWLTVSFRALPTQRSR